MSSGEFDAEAALLDFICGDWRPNAGTRRAGQTFILDSLGVGISGMRLPWSSRLVSLSLSQWQGGGDICVWGSRQRLSAPLAAMVNAYQIHNQEYDCVHEEAVVHPMAVALSCLLAVAEHRGGIDGRRFLTAVCTAVEVASLLGVGSSGAMRFFRPGICGALGATAGLAQLTGLDRAQTLSAMGLAYSQLGGTMQAHLEGSPALPMQIAFNARNAVMAVQMAQAGLQGPKQFLQGPFGFYRLFESPGDLAAVFARLGSGEIQRVSHKPFPTGRAAHGTLDGLLQLGAGGRLKAGDIEQVRVYAPVLIRRLVSRPALDTMEPGYARLCLSYVAARLLLHGTVGVEAFDAEQIARSDWRQTAGRITVAPDGNTDPNAMSPQRIEVRLNNGELLQAEVPATLGSPDRPLTDKQQMEKYFACTDSAGVERQRAQAIADRVQQLEQLDDMRRLTALLSGAAAV